MANTVLGGGYSARLNEEIRIKRGLSYGAGSGLAARRTTGLFRATAQTKNESAPQVVDLISTELTRLAAEPAGAEELKARKSTLIGNYGRNLATAEGLADAVGNLALYGVPLSELGAYTGKVEAVTPEQVQDFARSQLDPARMSLIVAGDAKIFVDDLKKRAPNLEVIPAADLDLDRPDLRKSK